MQPNQSDTSAAAISCDAPAHPLRCLHYLPDVRLEGGGVARAVLDWCTVLARRGLQMTLLSTNASGIPLTWLEAMYSGAERNPRAMVIAPPDKRFRSFGPDAASIIDQLLGTADLLHLHAPWLTGNRQIAAMARGRGVPYMITPHGMLDDWSMNQRTLKKRVYLRTVGRSFLEGAAMIHCTAAAEAEQAFKWFKRPAAAVLPYICDLTPFQQLPGGDLARSAFPALKRPGLKILFLSRLHEKKGCDLLLHAAADLKRRSIPFVFLMAGPDNGGYQTRLEALASSLGLADDVVFPGFVGGAERISLLQSADVLALPTHQENFGLVLTEALACGTPVITTRGVDIWREVQSAGGLIIDRTVPSLAQALCEIARDPVAARALGDRGRRWAFDYLDADRLGAAYERLYAEVVAAQKQRPVRTSGFKPWSDPLASSGP